MRARAGDPPRTMAQKILVSRSDESTWGSDLIKVKVDQVALTRCPSRVLAEAFTLGLKKTPLETGVLYDGRCVTSAFARPEDTDGILDHPDFDPTAYSLTLARAGVGFPPAVHLERFAAPARLLLTDDARLATTGGIGVLTVLASSSQLARALVDGTALIRLPCSVQVLLSGRMRPFVCARDVIHECIRRGLGDLVRSVEKRTQAPVVLEFAGPSAKFLSVAERAVLASVAPLVGATGALFISDEKTETYLRDQRRSKAHRVLVPDPGAPCEEVFTIDMGTVDPLVMDPSGAIRTARDVAGKPIVQAILGGDGTTILRDFLAAALLLKAKKVGPKLDFLIAPPSRQIFEVLTETGVLKDFLATGARLIEPDRLISYGELYPTVSSDLGVSARTCDPEPCAPGLGCYVMSAETLAYAIAHGQLGDPRAFKRPVKIQMPRELPTEDLLIVRERRDAQVSPKVPPNVSINTALVRYRAAEVLCTYSPAQHRMGKVGPEPQLGQLVVGPWAAVCSTLAEVRHVTHRSERLAMHTQLRAVFSTHIPRSMVSQLSGHGIICLQVDESAMKTLTTAKDVQLPEPSELMAGSAFVLANKEKIPVIWVAFSTEMSWVTGDESVSSSPKKSKKLVKN